MENYKSYLKQRNNILYNTEYRILKLLNKKDLNQYKKIYFSKTKKDLLNILLNLQKYKPNCKYRKNFRKKFNLEMKGGKKYSPSLYPQPTMTLQELQNKFQEVNSNIIDSGKLYTSDNLNLPNYNPNYQVLPEVNIDNIISDLNTKIMEFKIFSNNHGINLKDYQNLVKEYIYIKTHNIKNAYDRDESQKNIKMSVENWVNNDILSNQENQKRTEYRKN